MIVTLALHSEATEQAIRRLKARAPVAIARALNRSIASGKTAMTRLIAQDIGVGQSYVRDRIVVREATPNVLVAQLAASAKRIPVYAFAPSPSKPPSRGKGRGVAWRSRGGRVRELSAFIARVGVAGHVGVFRRAGAIKKSVGAWSLNLPIRELRGPSIAHVFDQNVAVADARAREQLTVNLAHELKFALSQTS